MMINPPATVGVTLRQRNRPPEPDPLIPIVPRKRGRPRLNITDEERAERRRMQMHQWRKTSKAQKTERERSRARIEARQVASIEQGTKPRKAYSKRTNISSANPYLLHAPVSYRNPPPQYQVVQEPAYPPYQAVQEPVYNYQEPVYNYQEPVYHHEPVIHHQVPHQHSPQPDNPGLLDLLALVATKANEETMAAPAHALVSSPVAVNPPFVPSDFGGPSKKAEPTWENAKRSVTVSPPLEVSTQTPDEFGTLSPLS